MTKSPFALKITKSLAFQNARTAADILDDADQLCKITEGPTPSFPKSLRHLMKAYNVTIETLAVESRLSEKTIKNYRNINYTERDIRNVLAICIAMHLHPAHSLWLLERAGWSVTTLAINHPVYFELVVYHFAESLENCNAILKELNLPLLPKSNKD